MTKAALALWRKAARFVRVGTARLWTVLGVLSASVILVNLNVLSSRFYERWDLSDAHAFTLSDPSVEILQALSEPIEVVVFLTRGDPLLVDVRHMLEAYRSHTRQLRIRYVDPDHDPGEFAALQQKYGIVAGQTEDGKLLTDTALVLAQGSKRWFLTPEDLVGLDQEGNVEPRLEQALTEGLAQVTQGQPRTVCFSEGHQEVSIDDVGPHGLAELRMRLAKSNMQVETKDLSSANVTSDSLSECHLLVVAGPKSVFEQRAAAALRGYYEDGGNLLLLLDPFVTETGHLTPSGLGPVTAAAGITLGTDFVIERDPQLRLPNGFGEAFLATPDEHAITQGLARGPNKIDFRVVVVGAQSLGTTDGSPARPLLSSSRQSFTLDDLTAIQQGDRDLVPLAQEDAGPYYLALAADTGSATSQTRQGSAARRMVVSGAANLAWSRNWQDPTLSGNRTFLESAVAWLVARPSLVSVPKRRSFPAGLSLTDDSLSDVLMYVMVYMPVTAALMGGFVLFRRRKVLPPEGARAERGDDA